MTAYNIVRMRVKPGREKEFLELNRKLRLTKASLEDLRRVDAIASRELGLIEPSAERMIVVERPAALPPAGRLASHTTEGAGAKN